MPIEINSKKLKIDKDEFNRLISIFIVFTWKKNDFFGEIKG